MKTKRTLIPVLALAGLSLFLGACESADETDHEPAPGLGALVIKNITFSDIEIFINGSRTNNVKDNDDRAYDMPGGEYRVVLVERDGQREWSHNVDVLEDRNTILNVENSPFDYDDYDVTIYYRKP